jgi:hypothetical protein
MEMLATCPTHPRPLPASQLGKLLQKRNIDGEKTSISRVIALQPPLVILELCHMPRPIQYKLARENRNAPTPAESLLWSHLRNRKTNGWKFLRQHPIKFSHPQHENQFYIVTSIATRRNSSLNWTVMHMMPKLNITGGETSF